MILWSIQNIRAYEKMLERGVLRADGEFINDSFTDAYIWMINQMKRRIGDPPQGVTFPVWAWYQWEGMRKRPDMRTHSYGWGPKGTPIVLLTIDAPENCVLLSDFDYWHHVLNDWDIIFPFDDDAVYSQEEKEKSWENIFDISCSFDGEVNSHPSTQATLWEIKREWVVKAERFVSR